MFVKSNKESNPWWRSKLNILLAVQIEKSLFVKNHVTQVTSLPDFYLQMYNFALSKDSWHVSFSTRINVEPFWIHEAEGK